MGSDPSLLALVLGDRRAPPILAWWRVRKPQGPGTPLTRLTEDQVAEICRVVRASESEVRGTVERLEIAQLLDGPDGGISDVAAKWLGSHVAEQIAPKSKGRNRRGLVAIGALAAVLALTLALSAGVRVQAHALPSPPSAS